MQGDQSWKRKERLRTYSHLINNIMGCNILFWVQCQSLSLKIEANFIKYCMRKGE